MYSELADTLSGFKLWGLYHVLPLQYYIYIYIPPGMHVAQSMWQVQEMAAANLSF